jgi:hypothetical protein
MSYPHSYNTHIKNKIISSLVSRGNMSSYNSAKTMLFCSIVFTFFFKEGIIVILTSNINYEAIIETPQHTSTLGNVSTSRRLSLRKLMIATARRGRTSSESYARIMSQRYSSCSGGRCPLKARINHLNTTRTLKQI